MARPATTADLDSPILIRFQHRASPFFQQARSAVAEIIW